MQTDQMPKEAFKLWKSSWDAYLKAMDAVSEQGEKLLDLMVKQGDEVREETKKMFKEWAASAKDMQGKYKQSIEETIKKFEEMF
jgi:polyhydroxyalkanoate synthesis regulator phasin